VRFYLDNAATTSLSNEMKSYLFSVLDTYGNPSSSHSEGVKAKAMIEDVRNAVSQFVNAKSSDEIYFTSSGSASNTLALNGYWGGVIYSPTCHKSILKAVDLLSKEHRFLASQLQVNSCGEIDLEELEIMLSENELSVLVVFEYANSEIGTIQNVKAITELVHKYHGMVMVDCTGSISSIPLDVQDLDIDIATFSGHKIGALKGVGVLYKKKDIFLSPIVFGSQEQGLFGGTENVLGIASLGKAIELLKYECSTARDYVWFAIKDIDGVYLVGANIYKNRLVNNLYLCIKGINGQELVAIMDDIYDTQISTGSACNNGESIPSSALLAIGTPEEDIHSCVRISFKGSETEEQLQEFCKNLSACINILRSY
jgi:cysteine desulfurase